MSSPTAARVRAASLLVASAGLAASAACGDIFHATNWNSRCETDDCEADAGGNGGAGGGGGGDATSSASGVTGGGATASAASGSGGGSTSSGASSSSSSGGCVPVAESCNGADDDCNGVCDDGAGCRIAVHRSYQPLTGEHFYSTDLAEAQCCGFALEFASYFFLYGVQLAGTLPLYRCQIPSSGMHLLTMDGGCEGAGNLEGTLGFIANAPGICAGDLPLYRLANPNGDHLFTTSAAEHDSAVAGGYVDEGITGYVWGGP